MANLTREDIDDLTRLQRLARELIDTDRTRSSLVRQHTELRQLIERRSSLPCAERFDLGGHQTRLDCGLAISPFKAALCARECFRTIVFIKGLDAAIRDARQSKNAVKVLYAGCGPFALLALPLMAVLSPEQAVFTLLDIHEESLGLARQLIAGFGLEDRVVDYVCEDATRYRIPGDAIPDVIVSETMNASLRSEPQVTIARRLFSQAPHATMVPQKVTVDACLLNEAKEYAAPITDPTAPLIEPERERIYLGKLFELSSQTCVDWKDNATNRLPGARIDIPENFPARFKARMLTRIDVYGDYRLDDYESSLNLPQPFPGKPVLSGGESLQFYYKLDSDPGLAFDFIG